MRLTKLLILAIAILSYCPAQLLGETYDASSCSMADINMALGSANRGDTVRVPARDCGWTVNDSTKLTIPEGVALIGAGSDPSGTNITIVSYAEPSYDHSGIRIQSDGRLSGFSFDANLVADYLITLDGNGSRIDHNLFQGFIGTGRCIAVREESGSLIDNNTFYASGPDVGAHSIYTEWDNATGYGTNDFLFIEDNTFYNDRESAVQSCKRPVTVGNGHKVVMRYNNVVINQNTNVYNNNLLDAHGYCHGPYSRSARAIEIYANTVTINQAQSYDRDAVYMRGGTALIYNNTWGRDADYAEAAVSFYDWRASQNGDGTTSSGCYAIPPNVDGEVYCWQNGYRVQISGRTRTLYGTAYGWGDILTGQSSGASAQIRGDDEASPDHLYFYSITNGPFIAGENLQIGGTTITTASADSEAYSGEGYPCTDQVGRGANQSLEPVYIWNNKDDLGATTGAYASNVLPGFITENTEYVFDSFSYTPHPYPHPLQGEGEPDNNDDPNNSTSSGGGSGGGCFLTWGIQAAEPIE